MSGTDTHHLERLRDRGLDQIDQLLTVARDGGTFPETLTPVSGWTALRHAEHMAHADRGALQQLEAALLRSREGEPGPKIRLAGRVILRLGWIPRGSGKAPATVVPQGMDRAEVIAMLEEARVRLAALPLEEVATARSRSSHPIFGGLTAAQWLRFLTIHHHHHLKVIADIRRAAGQSAS